MDNETWLQQFEAYLKRRFPDRSTAKHYVSDLRQFAATCAKPWTEVTSADIDTFVDGQRQAGRAAATVKRRAAALKTFFDFLAEERAEPTRSNPVSLRRHAGRQPRHLPRDLSDDEVHRLLAVIKTPRDQALVHLMLYAGLRVGEVAALRPMDITVPAEATVPVCLRVIGKGRKERVVYLYRKGYQPLAQYLAAQPLADPAARLFRNRLGAPLSVAGMQERITHYAHCSGVAVTCHRLRHTYGRWMAEREMPVLALARLLGHSSIQTTQRYMDGANPELQRQYEAAMPRGLTSPPVEPPTTPPAAPQEPVVTETATVVRPDPPPFARPDWLAEGPAWLREGCLAWIQQCWYQWKPSQRQCLALTRLRELGLFWRWRLAQRPLHDWTDLTSADIAAFVTAQLARGVKAKTVKTYLDRLYGLLRYLQGRGQLTTVPTRPAITLPDPLPRHLSPPEVVAVEAQVRQRQDTASAADWLVIALYYLLAHGGLRISEALDLQVRDLDLTARRVQVREGKGQRDRVVFLTQTAVDALRHYLDTVPHAPGDLALSWRGRPVHATQARQQLHNLGVAAGVAGLAPHRLRHTYATLLLNNGMDLEALRQLMGHEDLKTTLIYARLADATIEKQYRAAMEQVTRGPVNSM